MYQVAMFGQFFYDLICDIIAPLHQEGFDEGIVYENRMKFSFVNSNIYDIFTNTKDGEGEQLSHVL
jgi:hypothetical protein